MDNSSHPIVSALREEGVRVIKATLTMCWGRARHFRFTRKSRQRMRDASLSQLEFSVYISGMAEGRLREEPDYTRWLIRFYPETEKLSVMPLYGSYPEGTYSFKNLRRFNQMSISEKIACANHSARSIIMPDLPYQPDRSVTFHMPQMSHAETTLW